MEDCIIIMFFMKFFVVVIIFLTFVSAAFAESWKTWDPGTPIAGSLKPQYIEVKPGDLVEFSFFIKDFDHWAKFKLSGPKALRDLIEEGTEEDKIKLPVWFCDGGEFIGFGELLRQYKAPDIKGEYNITVVLEDIASIPKNDEGSRKDGKLSLKAKVIVK